MSGNVILEIIISLAFIYLLYSLLATIIVEIIAGVFRLRARNLRHALRRMLQDNEKSDLEISTRIYHWFFPKSREKELIKLFFEHPHIKYLGKSTWYPTPSYLEPTDFSRALLDILSAEKGFTPHQSIENALSYFPDFDKRIEIPEEEWDSFITGLQNSKTKETYIDNWKKNFFPRKEKKYVSFDSSDLNKLSEQVNSKPDSQVESIVTDWQNNLKKNLRIDPETRRQLSLLYKNSGGDIDTFKTAIEEWFNSTMERSKGWYKQWISKINFLVGLGIAISFNLNTIAIVDDLQTNTAKREKILLQAEMASSQKLDSLSNELNESLSQLNNVLGSRPGYKNPATSQKDTVCCVKKTPVADTTKPGKETSKWWWVLVGWLITALAISFGAPFWFDMLNKLMKLRTSLGIPKSEPEEQKGSTGSSSSKGKTYTEAKG